MKHRDTCPDRVDKGSAAPPHHRGRSRLCHVISTTLSCSFSGLLRHDYGALSTPCDSATETVSKPVNATCKQFEGHGVSAYPRAERPQHVSTCTSSQAERPHLRAHPHPTTRRGSASSGAVLRAFASVARRPQRPRRPQRGEPAAPSSPSARVRAGSDPRCASRSWAMGATPFVREKGVAAGCLAIEARAWSASASPSPPWYCACECMCVVFGPAQAAGVPRHRC